MVRWRQWCRITKRDTFRWCDATRCLTVRISTQEKMVFETSSKSKKSWDGRKMTWQWNNSTLHNMRKFTLAVIKNWFLLNLEPHTLDFVIWNARHLHLKWPVVHQQLHVIRTTAHWPSAQASYTEGRVQWHYIVSLTIYTNELLMKNFRVTESLTWLVLMVQRLARRDWRSGGPRFKSHPRLTSQLWSSYQLNQLGSKAASDSTLKQLTTCGLSNTCTSTFFTGCRFFFSDFWIWTILLRHFRHARRSTKVCFHIKEPSSLSLS